MSAPEWALTEESEALLANLGGAYGLHPATIKVLTVTLAAIERAAIARALTLDNVARALRGMSTDPYDSWLGVTDSPRAGEWETTEFAAVLIAALTETAE